MDSEEVNAGREPAGVAPNVRRSKKLAIAGAAVVALSIGMLAGGALGPGSAVAQTATETPAATPSQTPSDTPADSGDGNRTRGDRDCPDKDRDGAAEESTASETSI
jgi:hypothetical protein